MEKENYGLPSRLSINGRKCHLFSESVEGCDEVAYGYQPGDGFTPLIYETAPTFEEAAGKVMKDLDDLSKVVEYDD